MTEPPPPDPTRTPSIVCLVLILALAAVALGTRPIADPTEGRYAEIARTMADSGDWVTPRLWIDGTHIPYLGKPPLQFWAAAALVRCFGPTPWAVRLPNLLGGIVLVWLVVRFGQRRFGGAVGWHAGILLASSVLWQLLAGASTLAMTLAVPVALQVLAFHAATDPVRPRRGAGDLAFVGAGIALLAKGPIGVVLPGIAVVLWLAWTRQWARVGRLPWLRGGLWIVLIAGPWYALAERANPGFLEYFFYHEHVLRFLEPEYGDRYGRGHTYPYGTIWAMLLAVFLPWSIAWIAALVGRRGGGASADRRLALTWGLAPALFFTVARNVSPSYLLPGFAGLALFVAASLPRRASPTVRISALLPAVTAAASCAAGYVAGDHALGRALAGRWSIVFGILAIVLGAAAVASWRRRETGRVVAVTGVAMTIVVTLLGTALRDPLAIHGSSAAVLDRCRELDANRRILFLHQTPASAHFYAPERVEHQAGERSRGPWLIPPAHPWIVYRAHRVDRIQPIVRRRLHPEARVGPWVICRVR